MKHIKVEGHSDLYRDPNTGAIINKNKSEYDVYTMAQKARMTDRERINNIESDMNKIKDELYGIKLMLQTLLDR